VEVASRASGLPLDLIAKLSRDGRRSRVLRCAVRTEPRTVVVKRFDVTKGTDRSVTVRYGSERDGSPSSTHWASPRSPHGPWVPTMPRASW